MKPFLPPQITESYDEGDFVQGKLCKIELKLHGRRGDLIDF